MPGSILADFLSDMVLRPILEGVCHVTGRIVLKGLLGERLVVIPDEPEAKLSPRGWKGMKKYRQRAAGAIPYSPQQIRVLFSVVTLVGVLIWFAFAGLITTLVWMI